MPTTISAVLDQTDAAGQFGLYVADGAYWVGDAGGSVGQAVSNGQRIVDRLGRDWTPRAGYTPVAVRQTDDGFAIAIERTVGSMRYVYEVTLSTDGPGQLEASTSYSRRLDDDVRAVEASYDQDLDGDGGLGFFAVARLDARAGAGPQLWTVAGDHLGVVEDGGEPLLLTTSGGRAWSISSAYDPVGVRTLDGGGYAVLYETSAGVRYEQSFDASGARVGAPARIDAAQTPSLEADYGADIDGDGEIGVAALSRIDSREGAGAELWAMSGGAVGVVEDGGEPLVLTEDGDAWTPGIGREALAVRALDGGGYAVVYQLGAFRYEQRFDASGEADGAVVRLSDAELRLLEGADGYGQDVDGDGVVGVALGVRLDARTDAGPQLWSASGGDIAVLAEDSSEILLTTVAGRGWSAPGALNVVGVRAVADGFVVLMRGGSDAYPLNYEQSFDLQGVQSGSLVRLGADDVTRLEPAYGQELDTHVGLGEFAVARLDSSGEIEGAASLATLDGDDGLRLYTLSTGRIVVAQAVDDAYLDEDSAPLDAVTLQKFGRDWAPSRSGEAIAIRQTEDGFAVITQSSDSQGTPVYYEQRFEISGTVANASGLEAPLELSELALLERAYQQDFNGDDTVGARAADRPLNLAPLGRDVALPDGRVRFDDSLSQDRALYRTDEGAYVVDTDPDRVQGDFVNVMADGLMLDSPFGPWQPTWAAAGGVPIALRAFDGGFATVAAYEVGDTGSVYYAEQVFDAAGVARARAVLVNDAGLAALEGAYVQDFDLDGVVDISGQSFDAGYAPQSLLIDGKRLILTAAQAEAAFEGVAGQPQETPYDVPLNVVNASLADAYDLTGHFDLVEPEAPLDRDLVRAEISADGDSVTEYYVFDVAADDTSLEIAATGLGDLAGLVRVQLLDSEGVAIDWDVETLGDGSSADIWDQLSLSAGRYALLVTRSGEDSTLPDGSAYELVLTQRPPFGWDRGAISGANVAEIVGTVAVDRDLTNIARDHVMVEFNAGAGGSLTIEAGATLTMWAEHADGNTVDGAGTLLLKGDLRGFDFSAIAASLDISQADSIYDGALEASLPDLLPILSYGQTLTLRGDQAHALEAADYEITGTGTAVLTDTVEGLNLSAINVRVADITNAEGTPGADALFPTAGTGQTLQMRVEQADGQTITRPGAAFELFDLGYLGSHVGDLTRLTAASITGVVDLDLTLADSVDLGDLVISVVDAATLTLSAAQASGKSILAGDGGGYVVVTELGTAAVDLSGIEASLAPESTVVSAFTLAVATDLGALKLLLAATADLTMTEAQADGREVVQAGPGDAGAATISGLQSDTDLAAWGDSLQVTATVVDTIDVRANATVAVVDAYDVSGDLTLLADQADGRTGAGDGAVLVSGIAADTDLSGFAHSLDVTASVDVSGTLDASANSGLSPVDSYDLIAGTLILAEADADGRSFVGAGDLTVMGLLDDTDLSGFSATELRVVVQSGESPDVTANAGLDPVDIYEILAGGALRLTAAQADGRTGEGTGEATVVGVSASLDLSSFAEGLDVTLETTTASDLIGAGAILTSVDRFDLSAGYIAVDAGQLSATEAVSFANGDAVVRVNGEATTQRLSLAGADDVVELADGSDITGATLTGVETYLLDSGASVTMTTAQHVRADLVSAPGADETVNIVDTGDFSDAIHAAAGVETYVVDGGGGAAYEVYVNAATPDLDLTVSNVADSTWLYVPDAVSAGGVWALSETSDVLVLGNGSDISGVNGGADVTAETMFISGAVTMTAAQHAAFATITATGGADAVTLSTAGTATGAASVEAYVLADGDQSFTLGSASQSVTATGGAVRLETGTLAAFEGSIVDSTGAATLTLSVGTGAVDLSALGLGDVDAIEIAAGATAILDVAQAAVFGGVISGDGQLQVNGTAGGDTIDVSGIATRVILDGGALDDTFVLGVADATVHGGDGLDTLQLQGLYAAWTDLGGGALSSDLGQQVAFDGVERIVFDDFNWTL